MTTFRIFLRKEKKHPCLQYLRAVVVQVNISEYGQPVENVQLKIFSVVFFKGHYPYFLNFEYCHKPSYLDG